MLINKGLRTVYIGKDFTNTYNALREFDNMGIIQTSMTVEDLAQSLNKYLRLPIDIYFIEESSIIPSVSGNFIDAVEYLQLKTGNARIIVIAPGYTNPVGLKRLVSYGVYDFITNIESTGDPKEAFTTHLDLIKSKVINPSRLVDVKKYLDYEDSFIVESNKEYEKKAKAVKKNKRAINVGILFKKSNDRPGTEIANLFIQSPMYNIVYNQAFQSQNFSDIPSKVKYLIVQDPEEEDVLRLKSDKTTIISLYTSYAKYDKRPKDGFSMLYSMSNKVDFMTALENQIKVYQAEHGSGDLGDDAITAFIPDGYVKKTPLSIKVLYGIGISLFLIVSFVGIKNIYEKQLLASNERYKEKELELQGELMILELQSNTIIVNPNEEFDVAAQVKNQEKDSILKIPEVDYSKLILGSSHKFTYVITKGELRKSVDLSVDVKDTIGPDLILSASNIEIKEGSTPDWKSYITSAVDNVDGDVIDKVVGNYSSGVILYSVIDAAGNETKKEITVSIIKEVVAPPPSNGSNNNNNNNNGGGNTSAPRPTPSPAPSPEPVGPPTIVGPGTIYIDRTDSVATAQQQLQSGVNGYTTVNGGSGYIQPTSWNVNHSVKGDYQLTLQFISNGSVLAEKVIIVVVR